MWSQSGLRSVVIALLDALLILFGHVVGRAAGPPSAENDRENAEDFRSLTCSARPRSPVCVEASGWMSVW